MRLFSLFYQGTRRERRLIGPVVLGSVLFVAGLVFAYLLLIPAALNFFHQQGRMSEQLWSIDRYFEFVLLLLFSTGLCFKFHYPGLLGIVSSKQMLSGWRYEPGSCFGSSSDTLHRSPDSSLLAGAVLGLYFGGTG